MQYNLSRSVGVVPAESHFEQVRNRAAEPESKLLKSPFFE